MASIKEQFIGFYNTPKLFSTIKNIEQFEFETIDISSIDINIQINQRLPLGKRIEYFFEEYLKHVSRYKLLYKNIQVIEDKNTLGEIDFILYDKQKEKYLHTELVYKYYLYDESFDNEINRYIGPNRDDTLLKKLDKLYTKQFPLLYSNKTKEYIDIDYSNVYQNSCFKANIYLPYKKEPKLGLVNKECIKGFYINIEKFKCEEKFKSYKYYMPHRYDWVSDIPKDIEYKIYEEIVHELEYLISLGKSPLIWLKNDEVYQEFFITWW